MAAVVAAALCGGTSCGGSSAAPAGASTEVAQAAPPARTAAPVPPALAFVPAEASMLVRLDVAALRETPAWAILRQGGAALSAELPACDLGLLASIDDVLVAVASDGKTGAAARALVHVVGDIGRGKLIACLSGLSRAVGGFAVRETADGFDLVDTDGGELAAAAWTREGLDVVIGGLAPGSGPNPGLRPLLDQIRLDSAMWWVSRTDEALVTQSLPGGEARFEAMWLELRGHDGGLVLRSGTRFPTEEGAAAAPDALLDGIMRGIRSKGGAHLVDRASLERRLAFRQEGRWVFLDAAWSESELAAFLSTWWAPAE